MNTNALRLAIALLLGFGFESAVAATYTVTSAADSGVNTLRWAIAQANANADADSIVFNIGGGGGRNIALASALPTITGPVNIDATTQPGYAGTPLIQVDGLNAGAGAIGLQVSTSGSTIRGFSMMRFNGVGIRIDGAGGGNTVASCHIGLNNAGSASGNGGSGVFIAASPSNVIGPTNVISGNGVDGVRIDGATAIGNVVKGNRIGTDPAGTAAIPNGFNGVVITAASNNLVGGTAAADLNVISGNARNGIGIGTGASGNTIARNFIGLAADGVTALGNGWNGVYVIDAPANKIGGDVTGTWNIISANGSDGIELSGGAADGNIVQRNIIGSDLFGTLDRGNAQHGVFVRSGGNRIGTGLIGSGGNLISGNGGDGIYIGSGDPVDNVIDGNRIGTDLDGAVALPNTVGIHVLQGAHRTTIGTAGVGNTISGNGGHGIHIDSALDIESVTIRGNRIGTNAAGTAAVGNGGSGILAIGFNALSIGGVDTGAGNLVSGNGGDGMLVSAWNSNVASPIIRNSIGLTSGGASLGNAGAGLRLTGNGGGVRLQENRIGGNAGLGIDLDAHGVLANDAGDGDTGVNGLQNHPLIASAFELQGTTTLTGTLNSTPATPFVIEFFESGTCDASGHGEGKQFVGQASVTTNASGNANFSFALTGRPVGTVFSATASRASGALSTSEFSPCATSQTLPTTIQFAAETSTFAETAGTATITLLRSGNTANTATVRVDGSDWSTTAGADYQAFSPVTVTFAPGQTSRTVSLTLIDDPMHEGVELLALTLSNPSANVVLAGPTPHLLTITDNDPVPTLSMDGGGCSVSEGNVGHRACNIVFRLSNPTHLGVGFRVSAWSGTAWEGSDLIGINQLSVSMPDGATTVTVPVTVIGDTLDEDDETFHIEVGLVMNATPNELSGTGTIIDDDPSPTVGISDETCIEGDSGGSQCVFTIGLSAISTRTLSGMWATAAGGMTPATAGLDFTAVAPAPWSIAAGQTSASVLVNVIGDTLDEASETFRITLSGLVNAASSGNDTEAMATINDDDNPPILSVDNGGCSVIEGDAGSVQCAFVLRLSAASGKTVSFNTATANAGATAGSDYTAHATSTRSIAAGATTLTVHVPVLGDTVEEVDETFSLNVTGVANASPGSLGGTGTILDDDLSELIHFDGFE